MLDRYLPDNPRLKTAIVWAAAIVGTLIVTQFIFPGSSGATQRGTPGAILYAGLVSGAIAALTTAGIILIYRTMRVINFAQTALGVAGTTAVFEFIQFTAVPFPVALLIGLAVGAFVGAIAGVIALRFFKSSRLVITVVTIVGAQFLTQLASSVRDLPFFPDNSERTLEQQVGAEPLTDFLPFRGFTYEIGSLPQEFGFSHVFALEFVAVALLALGAFLAFTRAGVAVRAVAQNPERASLLGISVSALSISVWAIAGALSAGATTLTGMISLPAAGLGFAPQLLGVSFAAGVLAKMESIPTAVLYSVLINVLLSAFGWSYPGDVALLPVLLFLVISVGLLVQRKALGRSESATVSWSATEEQRAIPSVLARIPAIRTTRYVLVALALGAAIALPFFASISVINLSSVILLSGIIVVSIVVLTGWGGQVSLGQWAFAAIGAVVGAALSTTVGLPFWIAVPLAAAVTGAFAVLVGIPALRIEGLFLLVVTFTFAVSIESTLFQDRYFGWLLPDEVIERPTLFFIDFRDETSMYFLCAASLVMSILLVGNLRKSRTGRLLIALRENDANVQAFGIPVFRTKLLSFAISGALAGFAGAVFAHQQQGLNAQSFGAIRSVQAFVAAVFGGVGSVSGALLGAAYFELTRYFFTDGIFLTFLNEGGTVFILLGAPAGLISLVNAARDSVLRIVAQRQQIVVPSLFADYDAEALNRKLIPLADAERGSGLSALDPGARFALDSRLYEGEGVRERDEIDGPRESNDTKVLAASAKASEYDDGSSDTGSDSSDNTRNVNDARPTEVTPA